MPQDLSALPADLPHGDALEERVEEMGILGGIDVGAPEVGELEESVVELHVCHLTGPPCVLPPVPRGRLLGPCEVKVGLDDLTDEHDHARVLLLGDAHVVVAVEPGGERQAAGV